MAIATFTLVNRFLFTNLTFEAFFIGPQFTYNRYLNFLSGIFVRIRHLIAKENYSKQRAKFLHLTTPLPNALVLVRFSHFSHLISKLGLVYLIFNTITGIFFSSDFWSTEQFVNYSFISKIVYHTVTCYVALSKYLGVWLIGEGSSILCGIGYAGKSATGETNWHGLANVNPYIYETSPTITGLSYFLRFFNHFKRGCAVIQYQYERLV
jgi:hypothetical protein